jgi:hypothetical protein
MERGDPPVGAAEDHREVIARRETGAEGVGRKH